jgi:hypothetical protein
MEKQGKRLEKLHAVIEFLQGHKRLPFGFRAGDRGAHPPRPCRGRGWRETFDQ